MHISFVATDDFPAYRHIQMRKVGTTQTVELIPGILFADYDHDGRLLGVEALGPCQADVPDQLSSIP